MTAFNAERKSRMTPVVLLGGQAIALSVARSLGARGIPVYLLDEPDCYAQHSRFCTWIPLTPECNLHEAWLEWLTGEGARSLAGALLLPCCDDGLELIAKHRAELQKYFSVADANDEVTLALLDKFKTYELAEQYRTPHPVYRNLTSIGEVLEVLRDISFPCAIKPRHSHLFGRHFPSDKLFVATNGDEFMEQFKLIHSHGLEAIVSEIIPGADDHYFSYYTYIDQHGEPLFHFTKRKIRQFPLGFGQWTYHVSGWYPDVAVLGLDYFQQIGLRGIGTIEFKRDPRDGTLKLIECNPRFTLAIELLRYSGVEWALLVYAQMTGHKFSPPLTFKENVFLLRPLSDILASRDLHQIGQLSWRDWLKSIIHIQHFQYFRLSDPVPSLVRILPFLRGRLKTTLYHGSSVPEIHTQESSTEFHDN
jgi:D-aspartate ligase